MSYHFYCKKFFFPIKNKNHVTTDQKQTKQKKRNANFETG
jgi:hypothetical protein